MKQIDQVSDELEDNAKQLDEAEARVESSRSNAEIPSALDVYERFCFVHGRIA